MLFYADAGAMMSVRSAVGAVPNATLQITSQDTLPTIPLFTLAGTLLARGGTPERLVRVFRALAGWLPGGTAVAAVLVCAFFTTFTGASGVTILALGSLLLPVLMKDGYSERFSLGTVTASGSIGLLFPPSLPIILYGVKAQTSVNEMFYACILPGMLLVGLVSAYCIREGVLEGATWKRVDPREIARSVWAAKWEIALPDCRVRQPVRRVRVHGAGRGAHGALHAGHQVRGVSGRECPARAAEGADRVHHSRGRRAHHPLRGDGVHQLPD